MPERYHDQGCHLRAAIQVLVQYVIADRWFAIFSQPVNKLQMFPVFVFINAFHTNFISLASHDIPNDSDLPPIPGGSIHGYAGPAAFRPITHWWTRKTTIFEAVRNHEVVPQSVSSVRSIWGAVYVMVSLDGNGLACARGFVSLVPG